MFASFLWPSFWKGRIKDGKAFFSGTNMAAGHSWVIWKLKHFTIGKLFINVLIFLIVAFQFINKLSFVSIEIC